MPKRQYSIDGEPWIPLSRAAKLLGTNTVGVWTLIEEGKLEGRQSRLGSSIILVNLKRVADLRVAREQWRREREKANTVKLKAQATKSDMERGTMSPLRARLRNQLELVPAAKDGGPPGKKGVPVRNS